MGDGNLQISFRPRADALAEVRRELREWLAACRTPSTVVDELVLAADELCANAMDAAEGGQVHVDARCDGSAVHLAVSNAGHASAELAGPQGPPPGAAGPSEELALVPRGRGLAIVRAFTDSLAIVNVDGRTVARAVRLLPD
jgi:anti-sigma regulatory factor (Ser/Thr protein kinase)